MPSRYTRRTRLLIYLCLLLFASCGAGPRKDNSAARPEHTGSPISTDTAKSSVTESTATPTSLDTVTSSIPPKPEKTKPQVSASEEISLAQEGSSSSSGEGIGYAEDYATSKPSRPRTIKPGSKPDRTTSMSRTGDRAGGSQPPRPGEYTDARNHTDPSVAEATFAPDSSASYPAQPSPTGKDSMALSTLAYSYFDTITENETKYIWAKIKSNATKAETVTLLKEYIEHVMAQPPKASDTNSIKSIYIKGYRFVTISPDPSDDFDIALVDGKARQELDPEEGNNWRWSVKLKKGVTTPQSSITLRIKATNNVNGLKDFEDQQIIMIDVRIIQPEAAGLYGNTRKMNKANGSTGLIIGLIALALILTGILLRKKIRRLTGIRKKPQVFFSYAWGQEREQFVDELYDSLKADGYLVIRDKVSLGYKGVISKFMTSIGKGQFIVVAISEKYLTSEYCMFELFEIFRNSRMEKEELMKRIYPVCIENLNLKSPAVIARYLKFWEDKEQEWEQLITDNPDSVSEEQQADYTRVKRIIAYLGSLLDFLSDVNFLDQEQLSADNFQQIKTAIEHRITEEDA